MAGRLPNFMNRRNRIFISVVTSFVLGIFLSSHLYAQDRLASSSVSLLSPEDKLQALASTRFHFITLKQFHTGLFSFAERGKDLSETEASLLNAGLNVFLTSAERETTLLNALRQNKSVQIKFPVSENENAYEVVDHPTKPLLYHLQPAVRNTSATVEVKPLLDKPIAFQITLTKDGEEHLYSIDWSGNMVSEAMIGSLG